MKCISIAGTCVTRSGRFIATIVINRETGLIEELRTFTMTADIVLPLHFYIFPGFVDIHVHGRQDKTGKQNYKETYRSLGEAAINGGVVAVASMPNLPVPPTTRELYLEIDELAHDSPITVIPYAAIAHGSRPIGLNVPYKAFLAESVNDLKFTSEKQADETLRFYTGEDVSLHCDDNEILAQCKKEATHEKRRPTSSEVRAIVFALQEHQTHRFGRLKIVHCSTREGLRHIREFRNTGGVVFVEGTPHHSFADETILNDMNRTLWQMNPPLRSPEDRIAILEGLRSGVIDALADDHAPHDPEKEKALVEKGGRFVTLMTEDAKVLSGVPGLDTFGVFVTWLIVEQRFRPERITEIASYNPGQWLNQFLPKTAENGYGYGDIVPGCIGSLTIIDPATPTVVNRDKLKTKCRWSPFEGYTFPGRVTHTIVRGVVHKVN